MVNNLNISVIKSDYEKINKELSKISNEVKKIQKEIEESKMVTRKISKLL